MTTFIGMIACANCQMIGTIDLKAIESNEPVKYCPICRIQLSGIMTQAKFLKED